MNKKVYWVGFNLVKGIGAVRLRSLLDYFGDIKIAWQAPADALRAAGLSSKIVENLVKVRKEVVLDKIYERIQRQGIEILTWQDETYPRRLKEIDQPPPVLYLRGSICPEDEWAVSIVGTRRYTAYGKQVTNELASFLVQNGITIVSGMARGIDAIAHRAALEAGGRTFAVLGSGVDRIYPPEHRHLAEQIMDHGGLFSDYPLGTPPEGSNFPPRNRIISGLSMATVVVEAGKSSGALITASFAAEQGREVFAVPGKINAPQSEGVNRLIQQGACPLLQVEDVLEALNLQQICEHRSARMLLPADEIEMQLLQVIGNEPLHVDEIGIKSGLSIANVTATLAMMELKGMVQQVGGMNYISLREIQPEYGEDPDV